MRNYSVNVVNERYLQNGKIITYTEVSAGIDMALFLISLIAEQQTAKIIQLAMEYNLKSPFDSESPEKATPEMIEKFNK